jgi:surface antigen
MPSSRSPSLRRGEEEETVMGADHSDCFGLVQRPKLAVRLSVLAPLVFALVTIAILAGRISVASASQTECFSYGYACTPGYDATNAAGGWAWKYYGGSYAETPTGYHNCTLYAAWRLEQNGLGNPGVWGNAFEWINHTSHNNTPAVGAIAWWGSEVGGGFGHVAYVEQIRGSEVFVRADNYAKSGGYTDSGWILASSVDAFLHPHDLGGPPPPAVPSFLSPGALNRYSTSTDHWVTTGGTPAAGYGFESTLGFLSEDPGSGQRTLYSCVTGGDHFVSPDPGCEGRTVLGALGEIYTQPPSTGLQVAALYRCTVTADGDHFVSTDPACEGQHTEFLLGYVTTSQDRFNRYLVNGGHVDTARAVAAGATLEATLGFVAANSGAGMRALYSCTIGADQFTSPDPGCEGQHVIGLDGWVYTSPSSGWSQTSAIYRCTVTATGEHFVSADPACEGQHTEFLLGYIAQTHAALDRFVNPSTADHWITARAVPNGYQFEGRLGYMLQAAGAGRHALYSCMIGSDQFTSPDPGCEGQKVIGQDGWAYDSAPSGQQVTAIYRCTTHASGEHFVSTDPGCEGQHTEFLLGYIASTPAGANVPPPSPLEPNSGGTTGGGLSTNGSGGTLGAGVKHGHVVCVVPRLEHMTLADARRALRHAHCQLGKVRQPRHVHRHHVLRVTYQSARPETKHTANYHVNIHLR